MSVCSEVNDRSQLTFFFLSRRPSSSSTSSIMRGRSQSVILPRGSPPLMLRTSPNHPTTPTRSRSRPSSPQAKRPQSRAAGSSSAAGSKTPKKKKNRPKSARKASTSSFEVSNDEAIILPPVMQSSNDQPASPFKKKPLKRIRRPRKGPKNEDQS